MSSAREPLSLKSGTSTEPEATIIQVSRDFLRRYLQRRAEEWEKPAQVLKDRANQVTSYVGFNLFKDIPKARQHFSEQVMTLLRTTYDSNNINEWCKLIIRLVDEATIARNDKTLNTNSLFFDTLHAIRSYIIHFLKNDPELAPQYEAKLNELHDKFMAEDDTLLAQLTKGADATMLQGPRDQSLLLLAYLEHPEHMQNAIRWGVLKCELPDPGTRLPNKKDLHRNRPLHLQDQFYLSYYEAEIRQQKGGHRSISFDDYSSSALYFLPETPVVAETTPETDQEEIRNTF